MEENKEEKNVHTNAELSEKKTNTDMVATEKKTNAEKAKTGTSGEIAKKSDIKGETVNKIDAKSNKVNNSKNTKLTEGKKEKKENLKKSSKNEKGRKVHEKSKVNSKTGNNKTVDAKVENKIEEIDDGTKFRKVEVKNNVKESEKKPHLFFKTVLIVIGFLVIIYFALVIRNYYILVDIINKSANYRNITSYSCEIEAKTEGNIVSKVKYSKMRNLERMDFESIQNEKAMIVWKDSESNEGIIAFPESKIAQKGEADEQITVASPLLFEFANLSDGFNGFGLYMFVYSEEYNGKDCYVINLLNDCEYWIEKDTGLVLKYVDVDNKSETCCVSYKVNEDIEIYKPDLTNYEVKY